MPHRRLDKHIIYAAISMFGLLLFCIIVPPQGCDGFHQNPWTNEGGR